MDRVRGEVSDGKRRKKRSIDVERWDMTLEYNSARLK